MKIEIERGGKIGENPIEPQIQYNQPQQSKLNNTQEDTSENRIRQIEEFLAQQKQRQPKEQSYENRIANQSLPGRILEGAVGLGKAGLRGAEGLVNLPETLGNFVAKPIGNAIFNYATGQHGKAQELHNELEQKGLGEMPLQSFISELLPKQYGKPRSSIERFAQDIAEDLPLLYQGGGLKGIGKGVESLFKGQVRQAFKHVPEVVTRAVASNVGRAIPRGLGGGPTAQALGGIIGGGAYDLRKDAYKEAKRLWETGIRPDTIKKEFEKIKKENYKKIEPMAKKIEIEYPELKEDLRQDLEKLYGGNSGLPPHQQSVAKKEILGITDIVDHSGKINMGKALQKQNHISSLIKQLGDAPQTEALKNYYLRGYGKLNGVIDEAIKRNPTNEFGGLLKQAKEYHILTEVPSELTQILKESTDVGKLLKNPVAKIGLLGTGIFGGVKKLGKAYAYGKIGHYASQAYDLFSRSPEAKKMQMDIFKAVHYKDREALINNLKKLNDYTDQRYTQ